ncbi:hypothetical protein B0F90DRAFT_1745007 [Multifurca ochricompacta]|uniref:Uncharacterized protein n=1 Tax=Multifurca ochricompacta TaxID=376703 RepID=A0AAD4QIV8_9AGAM|nr:hypothetical protein B0F90DRAFT_1745007 [Multifurca ochricompacta]
MNTDYMEEASQLRRSPGRKTSVPCLVPGLTQSIDTPMSASASVASYEKWEAVSSRNNVILQDQIVDVPLFHKLLGEIKYPNCLRDTKFVEWVSPRQDKKVATGTLTRGAFMYMHWISTLQVDRFHDHDPYELEQRRYTLVDCWDSRLSPGYKLRNETELRRGTDPLIDSAFALRLQGKHIFGAERELFLPASPWTAKADVITLMELPNDWSLFLTKLQNPQVFSSEAQGAPSRVVTFAFEAKSKDNDAASRQLTLYLCSAQNQRRALGFEDEPLFGATIVGSILIMYISTWSDDKVVVAPTELRYNLDNLHEFIECYIFLCKVADHSAGEVENVFQNWESERGKQDLKERNYRANQRPWRMRHKPEAPKKSRKRGRQGDDRSQGVMEDLESFRDGVEDGPALNDVQGEEPVIHEGDPLIRANLRALEEYEKTHANSVGLPPSKDIRLWARHSAGSIVGAS